MTNTLFHLRILSLLFTATVNLISADPRGFFVKLSERIRQSGLPGATRLASVAKVGSNGSNSEARRLIDSGHFTAGIERVLARGSSASSAEIHLAQRTAEKLVQLTQEPAHGVPLTPVAQPRVLHVLTNSQPFTNSGYTVRSQHVLECQRDAGFKVGAVTRLGYPVLVGKLLSRPQQTINGITYRRLLPWVYPMSLPARDNRVVNLIVAAARDFRATALQTTTDYTNALVVAEAARRLDIPWVYEVRGELESTWLSRQPEAQQGQAELSEFYRLARAQETACMQAASAVISLSEVSKRQMVKRGVLAKKIAVVPNAVDEDLIGKEFDQDQIRQELGLPLDKKLVGSVTAVIDYEGLDALIDSLPLLDEEWQVLIVGDGSALPDLQGQAKRLGVFDRCHLVGRKPSKDIWKWYAALDVFVVPRKDTRVTRVVTPIKPLIAMALGVPVVASDLPALREVTGGRVNYSAGAELHKSIESAAAQPRENTEKSSQTWLYTRTWRQNQDRYADIFSMELTVS